MASGQQHTNRSDRGDDGTPHVPLKRLSLDDNTTNASSNEDFMGQLDRRLVRNVTRTLLTTISSTTGLEKFKELLCVRRNIAEWKEIFIPDDEMGMKALHIFLGALLAGYEASLVEDLEPNHPEFPTHAAPWLDALNVTYEQVHVIVPIDSEYVSPHDLYRICKRLSTKGMASFVECSSERQLHEALNQIGVNLPVLETSLLAVVSRWKKEKEALATSQSQPNSIKQTTVHSSKGWNSGCPGTGVNISSATQSMFEGIKNGVTTESVDVVEPDGSTSPALLLSLSSNADWTRGGPFKKLFVRDFYARFFDIHFGPNAKCGSKVVVLGTSGIGKSAFSNYAIMRALQMGKIVVIVRHDKATVFDPDLGIIYSSRQPELDKWLDNRYAFAVYDGFTAPDYAETQASVLVVTSLRKSRYWQFAKDGALLRYFPPWTRGEMDALRQSCFSDVPPELASNLYDCWGGVPRYVLSNYDSNMQSQLLESIEEENVHAMLAMLRSSYFRDVSLYPDRLVHLDADRTMFSISRAVPASELVKRWLSLVLERKKREQHVDIFGFSMESPVLKSFAGSSFEMMAHQVLNRGGSFRSRPIWPLHDALKGSMKVLKLEPSVSRLFSSVEDIPHIISSLENRRSMVYLRPRSKRFPCVDAMLSSGMLFQMAVGHHSVQLCTSTSKERPENLVKSLGIDGQDNIDIYFVMPEDCFESWMEKAGTESIRFYRGGTKCIENPAEDAFASKVRIFALEVTSSQLKATNLPTEEDVRGEIRACLDRAIEWGKCRPLPNEV